MPLEQLEFSAENDLITFFCEVDGQQAEGAVFLQCGEEASE